MKGERDVAWLGPAFAVLKCRTSTDNERPARKQVQAKKRTDKRSAPKAN